MANESLPTGRSGAQGIVRTLEAVVRAGRPETGRGGARLAHRLELLVERLTHEVEAYLEQHHVLCLRVTPGGLRADGFPAPRRGARQTLAATLLHAGGVVAVVIKQGVPRQELLRLVGVLHRSPFGIEGAESIVTMLWECDLRRIAVHCRDEFVFDAQRGRDQFDFVNATTPRADELVANAEADALHSSARIGEAFPDLDLDGAESPLRRLFNEEPAAAARLTARFPTTTGTLERLGELLTGIALAEADSSTKALARAALLGVVDAHLRSQNLDSVREMLRRLRPAATHPAVYATLRALGAHICGAQHVQFLATVLADAQSPPAQVASVHEVLRLLADEGVQPLWQHLATVTDDAERAQVIEVLAALCAEDPHVLAQHVGADSWEAIRDCIEVLGRIGGPRVLTYLGRWKRHPEARVRIEVVRALLSNQQTSATTMLCEILDDEEQRVRQTAIWVLAERRDARALPKLRAMILESPDFRDRASAERDDLFRALGRLADEETLRELAGVLEKRVWSGKGWPAELRRGAAIALGESSWPQARKLLDKHARSRDGRLRQACRNALHGIQDPPQVEEADHVG